MKSLIAIGLVAVALPLVAAEQSTPPAKDSPLVAAAKKSTRNGRTPANVITDSTLRQVGGKRPAHFTTTAKQQPLGRPAESAVESSGRGENQSERVIASESPKAKAEEKETRRPREDAASSPEGPDDENDYCPSCIIILDPVPPGSPMSRGILTKNPPRVIPPTKAPVVPPRQP